MNRKLEVFFVSFLLFISFNFNSVIGFGQTYNTIKLLNLNTISITNNESYNTDNDPIIVDFDKTRISIFSQAVDSLMDYYKPRIRSFEFEQFQLPSPSIKTIHHEAKAFDALTTPKPHSVSPAKQFFYTSYDKYKDRTVSEFLITNGHAAVRKEMVELPRLLVQNDYNVILTLDNCQEMFVNYYDSYFQIDFQRLTQMNPRTLKPKQVRRKLESIWKSEEIIRTNAFNQLKKDLFENDLVIKLTRCRYSFYPDPVSIYYNLNTDLFGIVNEKNNHFMAGGVASLCDYIDIYYFKWLASEKTLNQSQKGIKGIEFEQPPIGRELPGLAPEILGLPGPEPEDEKVVSTLDWRDFGLPPNYNTENWWQDTQTQLVSLFLGTINKTNSWYDQLKVGDDGKVSDTSEFEALTILQLEAEGYITGARRPDKSNPLERKFDTDFRFNNYDPSKIICTPTAIDVKGPIDPQSINLTSSRSLEQQVTDIVNSVESQQIRAKTDFNESLLHVINLLRIRPVDRLLVMSMFKAKAATKTIDLDRVLFLNIRDDSIY